MSSSSSTSSTVGRWSSVEDAVVFASLVCSCNNLCAALIVFMVVDDSPLAAGMISGRRSSRYLENG